MTSKISTGLRTGASAVVLMFMVCSGAVAASDPTGSTVRLAPADRTPPKLRQWVLQTGDNEGSPFIVIDKQQARLWLFQADGTPVGDTPVLLGLARGDASVPGIGERPMKDIKPEERTTPAGRFIAEPGVNAAGEDIFWIDYDAAVSMHRVRATNAAERRLERLASSSVADNRISYGCINVPAAFYDQRIGTLFAHHRGVVYILPEVVAVTSLFTPIKNTTGRP